MTFLGFFRIRFIIWVFPIIIIDRFLLGKKHINKRKGALYKTTAVDSFRVEIIIVDFINCLIVH